MICLSLLKLGDFEVSAMNPLLHKFYFLCIVHERHLKGFTLACSKPSCKLFYDRPFEVKAVQLDPRARFEYYVDHIINQFYLGCETPLPHPSSTPGFTEASAKATLELQKMLVKPIQRYIKRQVEREIFDAVLAQAGFDSAKARVRLNWGSPKTPEIVIADMLKAGLDPTRRVPQKCSQILLGVMGRIKSA